VIEIVATGPLATVQDRGRIGYTDLGVGRSGAADRAAHDLANRLVGNDTSAATIEITFGGLEFRLTDAATIALTGAECALRADRPVDFGVTVTLPAGTTLRLAAPTAGLRSYLAIRGGIACEPVLGSRSTDTLSGLGPAPLRRGDLLSVGAATATDPSDSVAPTPAPTGPIGIHLGPREDWFTPEALQRLTSAAWQVSPASSRVGVRLLGPALPRAVEGELPSEPTLPGAIQVPPDGQPIVLGPDAPVTGGYPVIAVVTSNDLGRLAQVRPGDRVRFSRRR